MLKPALSATRHRAPKSWLEFTHGEWLKQRVQAALAPISERIFGYHFASVGPLAQEINLSGLRVQHQFNTAESGNPTVLASPIHWPFAEHSLDGILSVGMLEFEGDPHQYLRELSRSLIADGYLLHVGFNPFAVAQVNRLRIGATQHVPWSGRHFSKMRVEDWLGLLNFEIVESGYIAPTGLLSWLEPDNRFENNLFKLLPKCSAMYYTVARKREYPLTFLKQRQKVKARLQTIPIANRME